MVGALRGRRLEQAHFGALVSLGLSLGLLFSPDLAHATETEPEVPLEELDPHRFLERPAPPAEPPRPAPPSEPSPEDPGSAPETVDLLPTLSLARMAGLEFAPEPRSADPVRAAEDRLDRELRGERRRDAIGAGRVDGYFHDLGRAMREEIEVDPLELQSDIFSGMSIPEAAVHYLGRYAGYERPIEPRGTPLPEATVSAGDRLDPEALALEQGLDYQNLLNGHVTWYRAEVRVLQNRIGEVRDALLLDSSGLPSVDEAALRAARRAVLEAPPPERVIEGRDIISSDWAIEIGDVATDPSQAGCTDPTAALTGGCAAGGIGMIRIRIQLLDVVDGMHPPEL